MMIWAKHLRQSNHLHDPLPPELNNSSSNSNNNKPNFVGANVPSAAKKTKKEIMQEAAAARF